MIKYNSNTISDWNYGDDNIIKVYRHNAVCYYKVIQSGGTTSQTPCFAVVNDISQYQETEFEDVFNKADDSWYKLNNLNQYEKYGLYGSGLTITTYEGKLTVDNSNEYIYSGGSWVNVGEVSGVTVSLPNVPFVLNYNAKNYDATTHSIPQTNGQAKEVDAVCTYNTNNIVDNSSDGYISITGDTRFVISGGSASLVRTNTETGCTMTIVSKIKTNSGYSILTSRGGSSVSEMHWMWRYPTNGIFLHGSSSYNRVTYRVNTTTAPITASVRVNWNNNSVQQLINDWTNNGSYTGAFQYGSSSSVNYNGSLFCDYLTYNIEFWRGNFYWVYMSQSVLTDEQIQQVIAHNEGEGEPIYPMYYEEKEAPTDDVTFSSMAEAKEYECPWVGMTGIIDGEDYIFDENYDWVTKYGLFDVSGEYICDGSDKYQKMEVKVRDVDDSWSSLNPPVYEKGDLIESASTDCLLPYDAEIEYLENNITEGSQYINTNQYLNPNSFEIGYEINSPKIYWGYVHQGNGSGTWIGIEDNTVFFGNFNNRFTATRSSTENVVIYAKSGVTINGNSYTDKSFSLGSDSINSNPLYIFGRYDFNQHNIDTNASAKLKSFYLKVNDELVLDLIPVRVGQVGYMYDKISGQLFGNVGTGNFILGADK